MNKILLIGPLPHRIEGSSVAFNLICEYFKEKNHPHIILDLASKNLRQRVGSFTFSRLFEMITCIINYFRYLNKINRIYLLVGVSLMGFIRDSVFILTAGFLKKNIILHVHSGGYGVFYNKQNSVLKYFIKIVLNKVDKIIVLGDLLKQQFDFDKRLSNKLVVIENCAVQNEEALKIKNKTLSSPVKIIYLSNMIESKGYMDCLNACKELNKNNLKYEFHFCGAFVNHALNDANSSEASEKSFLSKINNDEFKEKVFYHNVIKGKAKHQLLSKMHIFILPTYYEWEGQPISIIEAMQYGLIIITTKFRGIPELVTNGRNGFFVDKKNPADISKSIISICNSIDEYSEMSHYSRTDYLNKFTQSHHLNKIVPLLIS